METTESKDRGINSDLNLHWREINSSTMYEFPVQVNVVNNGLAYADQILSSFFAFYNLTPIWQDLELLQYQYKDGNFAFNDADIGVPNFGCSYGMSHNPMMGCTHPTTGAGSYRWISRAPRPFYSITALLRIYDTHCWILIIISVVSVSVFLLIAANVGSYYGVTVTYQEIVLIPFRLGIIYHQSIQASYLSHPA